MSDIVFGHWSTVKEGEIVRLTFPSFPSISALANTPSNVFMDNAPPFLTVTCKALVAVIRCRLTFQNLNLTCALTSFSFAILGSWTNAPPLVLGGRSPVVMYLRHSMIVWTQDQLNRSQTKKQASLVHLTVFPLPLCPTMTVSGE